MAEKLKTKRKPLSSEDREAAARLKKIWNQKRKEKGLSQEDFAYQMGWKTQGAVSAYINGYTPLGTDVTLLFATQLGVSPEEIRPGIGNKILAAFKKETVRNISRAQPDTRRIPVISYVQAGEFMEAVNSYAAGSGMDDIFTDLDLGPYAFALVIHGDSMEPEFREGDKIVIDPDVSPNPGDYVVAKNGANEVTFKKYRPRGVNDRGEEVFELAPLNEDYATIRSDLTPCRIIGTMIEHRRLRKGRVISRREAKDGERAYRERHAAAKKRDTK